MGDAATLELAYVDTDRAACRVFTREETERLRGLLPAATFELTLLAPPTIQYRDELDVAADGPRVDRAATMMWSAQSALEMQHAAARAARRRRFEALALTLLEIVAVSAIVANLVAMVARAH